MIEEDIRKELARIAVSEIGKKNVASAAVEPDVDFDDKEILQITIVLKPEAPRVSGETYSSILLKAHDFLFEQNDTRRPTIALERAHVTSVSTAK
ncbi:MAG: hypothetical protein K8S25_09660 [Alphaproteobacteria bacterium]|nr:hypothetical protein [Alphaproteobacteria bacterium]